MQGKFLMYNYLIVGSGLYGVVMAQQLHAAGKKVLVIDKRPNIAGNVYTENIEGIHVHKYGAHIFHTNDKKVWDYLQLLRCSTVSPTVRWLITRVGVKKH